MLDVKIRASAFILKFGHFAEFFEDFLLSLSKLHREYRAASVVLFNLIFQFPLSMESRDSWRGFFRANYPSMSAEEEEERGVVRVKVKVRNCGEQRVGVWNKHTRTEQ